MLKMKTVHSDEQFDSLTWGDPVDHGNRVTEPAPVVCDFTIIVDTREQAPWQFAGMKCDSKKKYRPLIVPTERMGLPTGDYSIVGHHDAIAIERKSPADAFGTFTNDRERFERELVRLQAMTHFACVIIECELSELVEGPKSPLKSETHSKVIGKTVYRSILAWQQRFRGVHWFLAPGRQAAERLAFRMLERYWVDRMEERKAAEAARQGELFS